MDQHVKASRAAFERVKATAAGQRDEPVLMLNLNQYSEQAGFPEGDPYRTYMRWLDHAVGQTGGSVLWRTAVTDVVIGCDHDSYDEILAVWYPSHAAFVALPQADGADQMFKGRELCVAHATILSLPGDQEPHRPTSD